MTTREIITKAIEKAKKNGWEGRMVKIPDDLPSLKKLAGVDEVDLSSMSLPIQIMTDHIFAKAFWGVESEDWCTYCKETEKGCRDNPCLAGRNGSTFSREEKYKIHLQQLVLLPTDDEKIQYVAKFL